MSDRFDLDDASRRLVEATNEGDGVTTARILEEAGSCNWRSLVKQTNESLVNARSLYSLTTSDDLSPPGAPAGIEKITLFRKSVFFRDSTMNSLGSVMDTRCENK